MKLKNKFAALLLCLVSPAGEVVAQTPRMERMMDKKQQNIVTLAALTAVGDLDGLKVALGTSLTDGMTVNEVKEVLVHTYAYCGFPRSLRGLQTLVTVLDEREAKGITDNRGREASPITDAVVSMNAGGIFLRKSPGCLLTRRKPIMPC